MVEVSGAQQVKPPTDHADLSGSVHAFDDAIQLYLKAFGQQFPGKHGHTRKRRYLQRFQNHLVERGHSLQISDLSLEYGQQFMDELVNTYTGAPLSHDKRKSYRAPYAV